MIDMMAAFARGIEVFHKELIVLNFRLFVELGGRGNSYIASPRIGFPS